MTGQASSHAVPLLIAALGLIVVIASWRSSQVAERTIKEDLARVPPVWEGYASTRQNSAVEQVRSLANEPGTLAIFAEEVEKHELVLDEPAPNIRLHNLGDSSVDFVVRPWTKTDDYWEVYWDITREVKMRFDAEGISIPFPQRDVHVFQKNG